MANTFPSSGFVGIGTASPNYLLDIPSNNNLYLSNLYITGCSLNPILSSGGTGGSMCLQGGGAGEGAIRLQGASSNSNGHISFLTNQVEAMRIITGGNVGIGTTSPDSKIHISNAINGGTNNYSVIIQNICTVSDARAGIAFSNNAQTPSAGGLSGASIQTSNNGIDGTGNLLFGTLLSGTNTERMRISYDGKVGIGCTTPTNTLEVNGTGRFRNTVEIGVSASSTSRFQLNFQNWNATNSYPYITFQNPAANCRHGIGINTSDNFVIGRATGVDCNFAHQDFVIVNSTGNVGINCITPTYKLQVNGTFYAAGSSQDYKEGICNYNTDSCLFMCLKPKTYQYKEEYCHLGKELKSGTQIGLIAEEVAESHPELAILVNEEDNKVVRNVDYEKLTIILLSELQKLRQEVDQLKNK